MLILVIGKTGQVARALAATMPDNLRSRVRVEFLGRDSADLSRPEGLREVILGRQPNLVINAAAYTAVDKAEQEADEAAQVNAYAPRELALACSDLGIPFIQYSTDYVFPGTGSQAWREDDAVDPLSAYGRTKALGEKLVREACSRHLILRTSWVYDHDGKNFLRTMLKLGAEREVLRVVSDQMGAPTSSFEIAAATWKIAEQILGGDFKEWGTYHLTASGVTSWHGFALAIFEQARDLGLPLKVKTVEVISTAEYPTPARRPMNSRLSNEKLARAFGFTLPSWERSLVECLARLTAELPHKGDIRTTEGQNESN